MTLSGEESGERERARERKRLNKMCERLENRDGKLYTLLCIKILSGEIEQKTDLRGHIKENILTISCPFLINRMNVSITFQ